MITAVTFLHVSVPVGHAEIEAYQIRSRNRFAS